MVNKQLKLLQNIGRVFLFSFKHYKYNPKYSQCLQTVWTQGKYNLVLFYAAEKHNSVLNV